MYRKLLTAKRVLVDNIKHLENELEWAKGNDHDGLATQFQEVKMSFADYKTLVHDNMCDSGIKAQLLMMCKTCSIGVGDCMISLWVMHCAILLKMAHLRLI